MRLRHPQVPKIASAHGEYELRLDDLVRIIERAIAAYADDVVETANAYGTDSFHFTHFTAMKDQAEALRFILQNARWFSNGEGEDNGFGQELIASINVLYFGKHTCPSCGGGIPNNDRIGEYAGAISRTDNVTEICSRCGDREAFEDLNKSKSADEDIDWNVPTWFDQTVTPASQLRAYKEVIDQILNK